jgi:hypothetical protein
VVPLNVGVIVVMAAQWRHTQIPETLPVPLGSCEYGTKYDPAALPITLMSDRVVVFHWKNA